MPPHTDQNPTDPRWGRLSTLFDAALDLSLDQRERFVVESCAGDAELLRRLRNMLQADAQAESVEFLRSPLLPPRLSLWEEKTDAYEPGSRRFGAYRLLKLIGRGGMGEVHLAERSDGEFEQRVALKLLPHPTPGLIQRFRQERQILARLEHPNIGRLLDGGVGEANVPYFAMEFVDGEPITAFVAAKQLDVTTTLQIFLHVCDAVQYAHRSLVVHRDIKPSNILVSADGVPKLLDFGIAKVLQTTDGNDATQTGVRVFTPDYAAPEQIRGEPITTGTDVYALGVVLYELLTGVRPYKLSRDKTLEEAILRNDPASPSSALGRSATADAQRRRALRGDLDRIVLTAMAKEPERRYVSVDAFAADIRRYMGGRPIAARGDSAAYRLDKFLRRNRVGVAAAGVVLASLVAATGFSVRQASIASAHARQAEAAATTANAVQDFMINAFAEAEPWRNAGHPPNVLELAESALGRIDKELAKQPQAQVKMYKALGRLFRVAGDVRLSTVAAQKAVAALEAQPGVDAVELNDARMSLFFSSIYTSDLTTAERVLGALSAAPPPDEGRRIGIEDARALFARARGHLQEYAALEQAIGPRTTSLYGEISSKTAQAVWHGYEAESMLGHYAAAQAALDRTYRINTALNPADAPLRTEVLLDQLVIAAERGSALQAVAPAARLAQRTRKIFGRSGYLADSLLKLGRTERLAGKHEEAIVALDEALVLLNDPALGNEMRVAAAARELGLAYLDALRPQSAAPMLQRALDVYQAAGGSADPRALELRAALARANWLRGDMSSVATLRDVLAQAQRQEVSGLPEILDWLAQAQAAAEPAAAESAWRDALKVLGAQGRPLCATAFAAHAALSRLFASAERTEAAQEQARTALIQAVAMYGDDGLSAQPQLRRIAFDDRPYAEVLQNVRAEAAAVAKPGQATIALALSDLTAMDAMLPAQAGAGDKR